MENVTVYEGIKNYLGNKVLVDYALGCKVKDAKNTILYAIVGLIVAILGYAIVGWVVSVVGAGATPTDGVSTSEVGLVVSTILNS